ncbi:MAG: glycosyl hydrolase [Dongiaceae bacterium]
MLTITGKIRAIAAAAMLACGLAAGAEAAELGSYKGGGSWGRSQMPKFESWLGHQVPRAIDFIGFGSWAQIISESNYVATSWRGSRWHLTVSVPMLPNDGVSTLSKGASGAYNANFRKVAQNLIAKGFGGAVVRLGWEFNGGWYPWHASKCASCFVAYWRQIVTAMRSVSGAQFKFDWTMALGYLQIPAEKAYPGDAYVDIIGVDVYNESWDPAKRTPTLRWSNLVNQDHGLAWHAKFAAAHGKRLSFPEWGTGVRPGYPGVGGGDDPYFIQKMNAWIAGHNVAYHDYWDYQAPDFRAQLSNNQYPKAGSSFRTLW